MNYASLISKAILALALSIVFSSCKKNKTIFTPVPGAVQIGGDQYTTIQVAGQTWLASNYRGTGGIGYDAQQSKPEYGRYYTYAEAKAIEVPAGWRLPTKNDFTKLALSQGVVFEEGEARHQEASKKLISTTRWLHVNGNNQSGFNAFPAGYSYNHSVPIDGDISEFWVEGAISFSIQEAGAALTSLKVVFLDSSAEGYRFNVRFVRDN